MASVVEVGAVSWYEVVSFNEVVSFSEAVSLVKM